MSSIDDNTLFVGNLDLDTLDGESILYELFSQCGTVRSIRLPPGRGFAFVEMTNPFGALYATLALNGRVLNGRFIRVASAMEDKRAVKVENLPGTADEMDVYEAFAKRFTGIRGVHVRRSRDGRTEGKATIWFDDGADKVVQELSAQPTYVDGYLIRVGAHQR